MNSPTEVFDLNLREALRELEQLIETQKHERLEDACIAVQLKGILWHLHAAWNGRTMSLDEANQLSQEEFDQQGKTFPDFPGGW